MTTERSPGDPGDNVAVLGEELKQIVDMLVERTAPWAVQHPELSARVLEQITHLVELLRAVLADRWRPAEGAHLPGERLRPTQTGAEPGAAAAAGADGGRPARVQRIQVRKAAGVGET
jgi:hypothetical protein